MECTLVHSHSFGGKHGNCRNSRNHRCGTCGSCGFQSSGCARSRKKIRQKIISFFINEEEREMLETIFLVVLAAVDLALHGYVAIVQTKNLDK